MFDRAPLPRDPHREAQRRASTYIILAAAALAVLGGICALLPDAIDATARFLGLAE